MRSVKVEFPVQEAMDVIRLLRAESHCLIENGDSFPDMDVLQRAQHVLSARERLVSALEVVAETEDVPAEIPQFALGFTEETKIPDGVDPADYALESTTTGEWRERGLSPVRTIDNPALRDQFERMAEPESGAQGDES